MQIREAREEYLRWLLLTRNHSPHTIRAYREDLRALETYLGSETRTSLIDGSCLLAFVEEQREAGLSAPSIRRRASAVKGFTHWLRSNELMGGDPWAGIRIDPGQGKKLPRVLPGHELNRLLWFLRSAAGADPRSPERIHNSTTLLAVSLMVATGVRVHEVIGLRCSNVNIEDRELRLLGKGRRERHVFLTNDWITRYTEAYLQSRRQFGLDHPYLLFNVHFRPLTTAALRLRITKAAAAAGLPKRVTPHMLRHTAATQLIEAGVDIRYIQRLLGHASLSTTEIYTHVSDQALKRVVSNADVLGRLGSGGDN